jgi:hypothetical protein
MVRWFSPTTSGINALCTPPGHPCDVFAAANVDLPLVRLVQVAILNPVRFHDVQTPYIATMGTPNTSDENSQHNDPTSDPQLLEIARPARDKSRLSFDTTIELILLLFKNQYLTFQQIGHLLNRHPEGIRNRFLGTLVRDGRLTLLHSDEPNHPQQAYKTASNEQSVV